MAFVCVSSILFSLLSPASGLALVIAGFLTGGIGQGFAHNVSTTAAMSAVDESKAGVASALLYRGTRETVALAPSPAV